VSSDANILYLKLGLAKLVDHVIATTLQTCGMVSIWSSVNFCVLGAQNALGLLTCNDKTTLLVGGNVVIEVVNNFGCNGCELQKLIKSTASFEFISETEKTRSIV